MILIMHFILKASMQLKIHKENWYKRIIQIPMIGQKVNFLILPQIMLKNVNKWKVMPLITNFYPLMNFNQNFMVI